MHCEGLLAADWDIAVPQRSRLRGLRMAAFTGHSPLPVELPIVPFPAVTLFIDLGDAVVVDEQGREQARGAGVIGFGAAGLRGRSRDLECLQVRLAPALAYLLLDGVVDELAQGVTALDAAWGPRVERLRDQLQAQPLWSDRFAILESALAGMCDGGRRPLDPEVAHAWRGMTTTRGRVRVERLAEDVGWSRKRLWSRFRAQLGITPKRAAQLIRFDHAAHRLAAGQEAALVAADCGYADQSHLHRETTAFAGLTPSAVAAAPWLRVDPVAWPR